MTAPAKTATMTSREFNQNTSKAKHLAKHGPVFITDRGRVTHVLLSEAEYQQLKPRRISLLEALAQPGGPEYDFDTDQYLPKREALFTPFPFEEND